MLGSQHPILNKTKLSRSEFFRRHEQASDFKGKQSLDHVFCKITLVRDPGTRNVDPLKYLFGSQKTNLVVKLTQWCDLGSMFQARSRKRVRVRCKTKL